MRISIRRDRSVPCGFLLVAEDGRTLPVQTDWDYPGVASTFGWVACQCGATDGTIDCAHRTASEMIADAADYLDHEACESAEDPGYFPDLHHCDVCDQAFSPDETDCQLGHDGPKGYVPSLCPICYQKARDGR